MRWLRKLSGRGGNADVTATPGELRDERLSASLDGELTAAEMAALERELGEDMELRAELEMLRDVRSALRMLGEVRAPRSFAITAPPAPAPRTLPGIELLTPLATAVAGVLFVVVLLSPGGEQVGSSADEAASIAAAPETAMMQGTPALVPDDAARGAALAAPAESPAEGEPAAAQADDAGGSEASGAGGEAANGTDQSPNPEERAAQPPTTLADQAGATETQEPAGAGDDGLPLAAGLAVLTAVLAALSVRQWRRRRAGVV